ncbi:MAG: dipeptide epimerase, partial [Actinomycetota bacterium]|nr:dipeptide epimerase [Actinomycetota bacterium]
MIARTRVRRRSARLREPFATSRGRVEVLTAVELTVIDADGAEGVGWASPATRLTGQTLEGIEAALAGRVGELLRGDPE